MPRSSAALLVALFVSLAPAISFAALVSYNDPTLPASADGLNITLDTGTSLEWLDVDVSVGRTFDDLTGVDGTNEFAPGGDFEGFRYARKVEIDGAQNGPQLPSLFASLPQPVNPVSFSDVGSYPSVRGLLTIIGCFGTCATHGYVYGAMLLNDGVTEGEKAVAAFTTNPTNWGRHVPTGAPLLNLPPDGPLPIGVDPLKGNWLVRAIPIPAPLVLMLNATGLLVLRLKGTNLFK